MIKTKLMGILNITPDSYYAASRASSHDHAISRALQLQEDGADIIDIGGESTRPFSSPVSEDEELRRVLPVIEALHSKLSIPLSIDTVKPAVARAAIAEGASLLNDVSGFRHPEMVKVAADSDVDICVMHMLGDPQTMQQNPHYEEGVVPYLMRWFQERIDFLTRNGIKREKIILDPGIGFGKTVADNLQILHNLSKFRQLGFRVLLGLSRKSFMSKILNQPPEELLPSTVALNTLAIMNHSIDFLRIHDVKEHRAVITVLNAYNTER